MIQLVVNTNMLREINERKLIRSYAKYFCNTKEDLEDDSVILENLKSLLDWDKNGEKGLAIYCSRFESIKRRDWPILVEFIKTNRHEIKNLSYVPNKQKRLENQKILMNVLEQREKHREEKYNDENFQLSGRGVKAKPCVYEGRHYNSRMECRYKEGISEHELYKYLVLTGQVDPNTPRAKKYLKVYGKNKTSES